MPSLAELSDPGYSWWDLYNVSNFYHSLGHDVFILSMPLKGINLGPGTTDKELNSDHWWFLQWEEKGDHPLRYFLEPAYLTMNYAKAQGYGDVCTAHLDALALLRSADSLPSTADSRMWHRHGRALRRRLVHDFRERDRQADQGIVPDRWLRPLRDAQPARHLSRSRVDWR